MQCCGFVYEFHVEPNHPHGRPAAICDGPTCQFLKIRAGVSWRFSILPAHCILNVLISKTAVSTSWPAEMRESSHSAGRARDVIFMTAHAASFPSPHHTWRNLYLQAVYETDKSKIGMRISEAERALLSREHELFIEIPDPVEREAVNAALHALSALRTCVWASSKISAA